MRLKTAVATGMLVGAGFLAGIGSASAHLSDCNNNYMCMWGNNDFNWMLGERFHGNGIANLPSWANDQMDSWANKSSTYTGCMYQHSNAGGDRQTMGRASNDNNVAYWNSDEVSSWRTQHGC